MKHPIADPPLGLAAELQLVKEGGQEELGLHLEQEEASSILLKSWTHGVNQKEHFEVGIKKLKTWDNACKKAEGGLGFPGPDCHYVSLYSHPPLIFSHVRKFWTMDPSKARTDSDLITICYKTCLDTIIAQYSSNDFNGILHSTFYTLKEYAQFELAK